MKCLCMCGEEKLFVMFIRERERERERDRVGVGVKKKGGEREREKGGGVWMRLCINFLEKQTFTRNWKDRKSGGIRGAVGARWTAGQHVERPIVHQGHDS